VDRGGYGSLAAAVVGITVFLLTRLPAAEHPTLRGAWLQFWVVLLNAVVGGVTRGLGVFAETAHLIARASFLGAEPPDPTPRENPRTPNNFVVHWVASSPRVDCDFLRLGVGCGPLTSEFGLRGKPTDSTIAVERWLWR
jgi:hypothetical protein